MLGVGASGSAGTSAADSAAPAAPVAADFTTYQDVLDHFVRVISPPGAPLDTRVDYLGLRTSKHRIERFAAVRSDLLSATPSKMSPSARLAWAINTYNFLVLEMTTNNLWSKQVSPELKARGIWGIPFKSVRFVKVNEVPFFDAIAATVEGKNYTLNSFERTFVFNGYAPAPPGAKSKPKPRPKSLDPRAHFALVCGALGCPPLQPRAFRAESLDVQLDRAVRDALAGPRHLRWEPEYHVVRGSQIFEWYEADFGGPTAAF